MSHDDFAVEPIEGLPETPPEGEEILWQGRPDWWALSLEAVSLKWIAGYFVLLAAWRFVTLMDVIGTGRAFAVSSPFLIMGLVVCAALILTAYIQARMTMYTITNRRVAMRIGAALTVTLNLPYTQVASADLDLRKSGTGTIALDLMGETRLSYIMCWPHIRPWHIRKTQPALRCIPDAARVAKILGQAADARVSTPKVARTPASGNAVAAE